MKVVTPTRTYTVELTQTEVDMIERALNTHTDEIGDNTDLWSEFLEICSDSENDG